MSHADPGQGSNSRTDDVIVFLNTRRTPLEHRAAFYAAYRLGFGVALIADAPAAVLPAGIVRTVHTVDTFDADAVDTAFAAIAAEYRVAGVVTWSDPGVEMASRLAAAHGLTGPSPLAASTARSKYLMRESLRHRPDLVPAYARVTSWESTRQAAGRLGFPLVLKPVSGNGSKGIHIVRDERQLKVAYEALAPTVLADVDRVYTGYSGQMMLEELLVGTEHSVEGWVHGGEVVIAGVTDKTSTPDYRLEVGHLFPSALPIERLAEVEELTRVVVSAFGIDDCAFHLECMVAPEGGARLVECAARGGGDFITSHLVGLATGESFCENTVRVATGRAPVLPPAGRPPLYAGLKRLLADRPGVMAGVDGIGDALSVAGVEHVVLERPVGASVDIPPADFVSSAVVSVIATGESAEAVQVSLAAAEKLLSVRVVDHA